MRFRKFVAIILFLLLSPHSGGQSTTTGKDLTQSTKSIALPEYLTRFENPHVGPYAYALAAAVWQSPKIYVCWDNPSDNFKNEMQLVEKSIKETWGQFSALVFAGWEKCADVNRGIRITIADDGPRTLGLGRQLDGVRDGMHLNFTFQNWSPSCQDNSRRSMCIRSVAIHEFGHAIGFAHEQNRPDKPGECLQSSSGPNGDLMLTPYDKESVNNYCFNIYNPDLRLSALDIDAIRTLYGTGSANLTQKL